MPRFPKLIAFVAGLISAAAFAPLDLWPLMPLAFAVLLWLLADARTLWLAAGLGWWFGLGQFVVGLNWIATAFTYQAAMPAWLGWVAVVLLSLYLALYPMIATAGAWLLVRIVANRDSPAHPLTFATFGRLLRGDARLPTLPLALALAATWIAGEWLRATCFTGFAWNPVGVTWLWCLPYAHAATLIGTYGLSALTILTGAVFTAAARRDRVGAPVLFCVLLCGVIPGLFAARPSTGGGRVPITVVQPNIGQDEKWREDEVAIHFARLAGLSGRRSPAPRLLLWPEAAVPEYLEDDPLARERSATLLGSGDVLLTGGVSLVRDPGTGEVTAARNSLFALDAGGAIVGRYDKAHLVPYGEYLPMRPLLSAIGLSRLAPGDLDFNAGPGPRTLSLPGLVPDPTTRRYLPIRVGIQICYEIIFSGHVIDRDHRPDLLFNPSNDAWFGRWGPPQHLAQARLRAIEEAMPVVRSTPTGISAVVDANGRLLATLPWRTAGAIDTMLPPPAAPTPFSRYGNLLPALFALLLAAGAVLAGRRATRRI